MPVRPLPPDTELAQLEQQARHLLHDHAARLPQTAQKLREFHPDYDGAADEQVFNSPLSVRDAQRTIAREHGFRSWGRLKRHLEKPTLADQLQLKHHERIEEPVFRRAVDLLDAGDAQGLRAHLSAHPRLVHQHVLLEGGNYFRSPSLLAFSAENPIRHGKLPANIVEVVRVILEAGPDRASRNETLMLVATGSVARECNVQRPLIALLCQHGADPNTAVRPAAVLSEHDAVLALLEQGARLDLPVAAALGRLAAFEALFPSSTPQERHLALALAAQFGHVEPVRLLLEAGEKPDRYNPPGGHSHGTPLHHAAAAGHLEIARLLVEHGARTDLKDVLWGGTPADWAVHEGKQDVADYLQAQEVRSQDSAAEQR